MALLDPAVLDRIDAEAREVHFGRTLLTLFAAFFFAIGWLAAKAFTYIWLALAWTVTAVKVGWQEGRKTKTTR